MSEAEELKEARNFVILGQKEKALPLLWKLYTSKGLEIKLDTGLILLVVLDRLTENKKLIDVTNETIKVASTMGKRDVRAYLLSKKAEFLFGDLTFLTYRQRNLNLAAGVFKWIDFSLEKDKKEYAAIITKRNQLEKEISSLEADVLTSIQSSQNHYLRGLIFMSLGLIAFLRFLNDHLDLMIGGKLRSKIVNIYFVRRWNLYRLIGYSRDARRKFNESWERCVNFSEKAIAEFKSGDHEAGLANAFYEFAVKFTLIYRFSKAKRYLNQAKQLAKANNEKLLLVQIGELEKHINDRNRPPRNYIEEFGLDLPR